MPGLVSRQVRRSGQAGQGALAKYVVYSLALSSQPGFSALAQKLTPPSIYFQFPTT